MITSLALILVLLFGISVAMLCCYGLYAPQRMMAFVTSIWNKPSGLMTAVLARIVMGLSLIFAASSSRFPTTFFVIGFIALLAAVGILLAGRERVNRLIAWGAKVSPMMLRLWLGFGLLFSLFLIYAAL